MKIDCFKTKALKKYTIYNIIFMVKQFIIKYS